jgi:trk system potassium uptake protein
MGKAASLTQANVARRSRREGMVARGITGRHRPRFWRRLTESQLLVGSFALLIAAGTTGFMVLPGLYAGPRLTLLDALFTATSAVCVTGLIVVDTATYFTRAGQLWILILIQLGGLGIMTFATLVILALGRRLSLRHEALSRSVADLTPHVNHLRLTADIVRFTLVFEATGAVILCVLWLPAFGPSDAAFHAVFQAVSAFCNAGFSTFSDSLTGFRLAPATLVTVMLLIASGGLGFLTLEELYLRRRAGGEGRIFRLSLHSRLVLVSTAVLVLGGGILYTALEWQYTLAGMPAWARAVNGLFMSVTARTAGFSTVDYGQADAGTNFLTILLMSIGGSPGSTAGGMKTTTAALIALFAWSRFMGRSTTSVAGRSVPIETVQRAVGLFAAGFMVMTVAILVHVTVGLGPAYQGESSTHFLPYMFEAASAFNTVGLSMGVTSEMGVASRTLTILLMFMGRVGPLAFAAALTLARPTRNGGFRYAYEDVVVG